MGEKVPKNESVKVAVDIVKNTESSEGGQGPETGAEERLAKAVDEARNNYDRFLRVSAEFENYKKRTARETEDFRKYANETLLKDLLPVIDNLERALCSMESDACVENLSEGVKLTLREILKVLDKHGASPIEAMGAPFDPCRHQALMIDDSGANPPNTVVRELQKGYMLKERLLRPALVAVSADSPVKEACEDVKDDSFAPEALGY